MMIGFLCELSLFLHSKNIHLVTCHVHLTFPVSLSPPERAGVHLEGIVSHAPFKPDAVFRFTLRLSFTLAISSFLHGRASFLLRGSPSVTPDAPLSAPTPRPRPSADRPPPPCVLPLPQRHPGTPRRETGRGNDVVVKERGAPQKRSNICRPVHARARPSAQRGLAASPGVPARLRAFYRRLPRSCVTVRARGRPLQIRGTHICRSLRHYGFPHPASSLTTETV